MIYNKFPIYYDTEPSTLGQQERGGGVYLNKQLIVLIAPGV